MGELKEEGYFVNSLQEEERTMTVSQMKEKKIELGLTNEMIAQRSGIPLSTIQKIFSGITKAPRKQSLDAIQKVLLDAEMDTNHSLTENRFTTGQPSPAGMVREPSFSLNTVPKDRLYTIDDYYALPEDQRAELIDGVFYEMGAPALMHQFILGELYILFRACADEHDMPCDVYLSPCDVRLDRDNYTMVQPDLLVICGEYDAGAIRYEGPPDLVVEILSPSTRMKDMTLKLYKYQRAGVREYWIVDPVHKAVTVHLFDTDDYNPEKYSFDDQIPIGISGGACRIDFSKIQARLAARGL